MYAYVQHVPIGPEVYARIKERLGDEPFAGLVVHLALRKPDGTLTYVDVWECREACARAFDEQIHPAVFGVFEEIGFQPDGEPARDELEVVDVLAATWSEPELARDAQRPLSGGRRSPRPRRAGSRGSRCRRAARRPRRR